LRALTLAVTTQQNESIDPRYPAAKAALEVRLSAMEAAARLMLTEFPWADDRAQWPGQDPPPWGEEELRALCEQPFPADFYVPARDFLEESASLKDRLVEAASYWPRSQKERPRGPGRGETLGQYLGRKTNEELCDVLQDAPARKAYNEHFGVWSPGNDDDQEERGSYWELRKFYEQTAPSAWCDEQTAEEAVRVFLKARGVPADTTKNLFSYRHKREKREAARHETTSKKEGF
jgi:hypothetical protein